MKKNQIKSKTDIEFFESIFDCIHSKRLTRGLEVRVLNIDAGKHEAAVLIKRHNLKLEITTEGNMVTQRAFLVRPIAA
jgi:hypothetical protein